MKKVIITVNGIQITADEPAENMELITEGEYTFADGMGFFTYEESEMTGMAGTTTRFDFSPTEAVITREGTVSSKMVFVEGKMNVFLYNTPYGTMTMGIDTHKIENTLTEKGGVIDIDYTLTFDRAELSRNRFNVKIKEQAVE
jgi:uncharacterized beta-barrel protein YwiB (DUF1934 family)